MHVLCTVGMAHGIIYFKTIFGIHPTSYFLFPSHGSLHLKARCVADFQFSLSIGGLPQMRIIGLPGRSHPRIWLHNLRDE